MRPIREPQNINFAILYKPWTDEERKEFSAFIKFGKSKEKTENTLL